MLEITQHPFSRNTGLMSRIRLAQAIDATSILAKHSRDPIEIATAAQLIGEDRGIDPAMILLKMETGRREAVSELQATARIHDRIAQYAAELEMAA